MGGRVEVMVAFGMDKVTFGCLWAHKNIIRFLSGQERSKKLHDTCKKLALSFVLNVARHA